jgi:hypothetical protein
VPLQGAVLDAELWEAARRAFGLANVRRLAVRSVAVALDRLEETPAQLDLWQSEGETDARVENVVEPAMGRSPGADSAAVASPDRDPAAAAAARGPALQQAIDRIRGRWGTRGVVRGAGLAATDG